MSKSSKTFGSLRKKIKKLFLDLVPEPVLMPLRKLHYARILRSISEGFEVDFAVIKHLVVPGDHVIDLGAHVGMTTKYLSDLVGETGRVYSVEPFPLNFDILRSNVKNLSLTNVELINCAVSDTIARVTMEVPQFSQLGESFYDARFASENSDRSLRRADVEVKTIDSLFFGIPVEYSFVKCDVEGQELESLRGAISLIKRDKPAWLVEISLMKESIHREVLRLLEAEGYKEYWFDEGKLRRWKQGDRPINVFFLNAKHVEVVEHAGLI